MAKINSKKQKNYALKKNKSLEGLTQVSKCFKGKYLNEWAKSQLDLKKKLKYQNLEESLNNVYVERIIMLKHYATMTSFIKIHKK